MKTLLFSAAVFTALCTTQAFALTGNAPSPVLYPNKYLSQVGEARANQDIAQCSSAATRYVESSKTPGQGGKAVLGSAARGALLGTVGGAIMGNTGRGAAAGAAMGGTASVVRGVRESGARDPAFQQYVNSCLEDKGYRVLEWR